MYRFFQIIIPALILSSCYRGINDDPKGVKNSIEYASTLEIYPMKGYIQVRIINPTTKRKTYYALAKTRPRFGNAYEVWIKTPVRSMITLSGTHIGMLAKLGEIGRIKGVTNKNYIYNSDVLKSIKDGNILAFDNEESIPVESIIRSNAELLIYSGFGSDFPHQDQLKRTGTICIPNYDWKEVHPLGTAEWIKLFGYLTGKEKEANAYFNKIANEYQNLKSIGQKFKNRPSVFSGNAYGDIWLCPAGESFNAKLMKDAGGNYIYRSSKGTGSLELSPEKVFHDNVNTEFWLNPGIATLQDLIKSNPRAKYYSAYKKGKIYCYSTNMNYFWEMGAIEPHHVLSDLLTILHPGSTKEELNFYQMIK